jgi:hypothetical protein
MRFCSKCGAGLGQQYRAKADVKHAQFGLLFRVLGWIGALVVLALIGPPIYHVAAAAYLKHQIETTEVRVNSECGGPIQDNMGGYMKDQINDCVAKSTSLRAAKQAYADFTKNDRK